MARRNRGLGALLLATTALIEPALALAAETQVAQARETMTFAIPGQPLEAALTAFSAQSRVQVVAKGEVTRSLSSAGVTGTLAPEEALHRLLAGTGVGYRFTDPRTVILEKLPENGALTLDPVSVEGGLARAADTGAWGPVQGYVAKRAAGATKTDTPILETAQAISVVTADQIADRKVTTVEDAVAYTSGVRVGNSGFDPRFDQIYIRGFEATITADFLDGLRQPNSGWLSYYGTEPYALERIEVVKGPSSVLYGQINPGGLVNRVSKRPSEAALREVEVQVGNNDHYQGQFDLGGRLSQDGTLLYRAVGVMREAGTDIEQIDDDIKVFNPSLTWKPNADTSLTLLAGYQFRRTSGSPRPYQTDAGVLTEFWPGDEDFDKLEQTQYTAGYQLEHAVTGSLTLRQNLRYGNVDTVNQYTSVDSITDGHILARSSTGVYETMQSVAVDNQAQYTFATGPAKHTLLGGVDYMWLSADVLYATGTAPSIDMWAPNYNQSIARPGTVSSDLGIGADMVGFYAQDQVAIDRWRLTAGLRHDLVEKHEDNRLKGTTTEKSEQATTGRLGALYLFDMGLAPYVSAATSFTPETGTDKAGRMFNSSKGRQVEVGTKYQPPGSNSLITASLFQLTQTNVKTTDPSDSNFQVQTGEQRARGLELEAVAELTDELKLLASYSYTKAEVTKSNDGNAGKRPVGVPEHLASLWGDYTFGGGALAGLGFGAGARWNGPSYDDAANTKRNESYTLADAAVHYDLDGDLQGARLALNVNNLFDERYITCESSYCYRGQGRSVIGSVRYRW